MMQRKIGYCHWCCKQRMLVRNYNNFIHFIIFMASFGLWLLPWVLLNRFQSYKCPICHSIDVTIREDQVMTEMITSQKTSISNKEKVVLENGTNELTLRYTGEKDWLDVPVRKF